MPCGTTSLASSLPHGTEDKDPLGLPSEGWQPLAHDAMDMLSPSQCRGLALPAGGLEENLPQKGGTSLHRQEQCPLDAEHISRLEGTTALLSPTPHQAHWPFQA